MHRRRFLCRAALALLSLPAVRLAAADERAEGAMHEGIAADLSLAISTTVWGIVGYARWPEEPTPLRVCVVGHSAYEDALRNSAHVLMPGRQVDLGRLSGEDNPVGRCDVVYVGAMAPARRAALLQQLHGLPVLTIGEDADFCSDGGMFCLEPRDDGLRFEANLDAIARSQLRINPQVLRLSRRLQQGGV